MSNFHTAAIPHVDRLSLSVSDLSTSLHFYTQVLGLSVLNQSESSVQLGVANRKLLQLDQAQDPRSLNANTSGLYHFALLLPNYRALAHLFKHMVQQGTRFQGASDHLISNALYLSDPDGYGIELACDTDPATWPWVDDQLDIFAHNKALDIEQLYAAAQGDAFDGLPAETRMGHIHLHVENLKQSHDFYTNILKMNVVIELTNSALFFSYANYHHHIAINRWQTNKSKRSNAVSFYLYFPPDELDALVQRLNESNTPYTKSPQGLVVQDPNQLTYILHSTFN